MTEDGSRIAKVLARAGVASRREAEVMITAGRVSVNGKRIDSPALNVTARDRISVDGKPLAAAEPARLWMYHKPLGLVTTTRDEQGRQTVFDALPDDMPRVMSIGRLDLNSEGLLLLTNDGDLKRRLELPSTGWLRKYRVRVNGAPTDDMLAPLRDGVKIEGEQFQPMIVNIDRQQGANAWLTIGIREGRNREIRRAMDHVGLSVNRLIRISYGPFQLGQLAKGAVSEVKSRVLREQLGEAAPQEELVAKGRTARPAGPKPTGPKAAGQKSQAQKPQGQKPQGQQSRGKRPPKPDLTGTQTGPRPPRPNSAPRSSTARPKAPAKPRPAGSARPPNSKR